MSEALERPLRKGDQSDAPVAERRRWRFAAAPMVTLIGVLLAAGISGTTLVYTLWPGLKPDPKEKVGAEIRSLAVDREVTRGEYLCRFGPVDKGEPRVDVMGNVYYIRAEIEGFKRSSVNLKWFTYNADNDQRRQRLRSTTKKTPVFRPQAPINTQIAQVWVPTPNRDGHSYVRFELYAKDVLLAFVDSRPFETRAGGLPPRHPFAACK